MKHRGWRYLGVAILLALILLLAFWKPLRAQMARWTGEQDLFEQVKGSAALGLLRLTHAPPETAPYVPVQHSGLSPYGVNTFFEQEADAEQVERAMAMISAAGIKWIRQEFPWEDIEISAKGDYWDHRWDRDAWAKYDRIVALAEEYDLEIIARLDNPPAWSRSMGDTDGWSMAPPDDPEDYGDFVAAVVERYQGRIRYYQIWNEPNIYPEWGDQPADPAGYVELLQIAYTRAKAIDPDCVIIAAGLAQTIEETPWEFGPRNVSDLIYLEEMYAAGAQGYFDVMGSMVYGLWTGPMDQRASRDRTNFARAQLLREIMVAHGDADIPIWATEVGWSALPVDWQGDAPYGRVTEAQQAEYTIQAYERSAREWPWMGVMNYWFWRRPNDSEQNQPWYYFRMVEPDWTTLPVYDAVAAQAQETPIIGRGFFQEDHYALSYAGEWSPVQDEQAVLGGSARLEPGASVAFTFYGTGLSLVLAEGDAEHITVEIDGRVRDGRRSEIVPGTEIEALRIVRGLRRGEHQVTLTVHDQTVILDGGVVYTERACWPWLVGLAALIMIVGLTWLRHRRARR